MIGFRAMGRATDWALRIGVFAFVVFLVDLNHLSKIDQTSSGPRAANEARADDAPLPEYPCLTNYRRCTDNHDVAVMHQVKNVYRGIAHNADVIPISLACEKEAELHGYPWIQGAFYDPYRTPGRSFIDKLTLLTPSSMQLSRSKNQKGSSQRILLQPI